MAHKIENQNLMTVNLTPPEIQKLANDGEVSLILTDSSMLVIKPCKCDICIEYNDMAALDIATECHDTIEKTNCEDI